MVTETSLRQMLDILNCRTGKTKFGLESYQNGLTGEKTYTLFYGIEKLNHKSAPFKGRDMEMMMRGIADYLHFKYLERSRAQHIEA